MNNNAIHENTENRKIQQSQQSDSAIIQQSVKALNQKSKKAFGAVRDLYYGPINSWLEKNDGDTATMIIITMLVSDTFVPIFILSFLFMGWYIAAFFFIALLIFAHVCIYLTAVTEADQTLGDHLRADYATGYYTNAEIQTLYGLPEDVITKIINHEYAPQVEQHFIRNMKASEIDAIEARYGSIAPAMSQNKSLDTDGSVPADSKQSGSDSFTDSSCVDGEQEDKQDARKGKQSVKHDTEHADCMPAAEQDAEQYEEQGVKPHIEHPDAFHAAESQETEHADKQKESIKQAGQHDSASGNDNMLNNKQNDSNMLEQMDYNQIIEKLKEHSKTKRKE